MKSKIARTILNFSTKIDVLASNIAGNGMYPEFISNSGFAVSKQVFELVELLLGLKVKLEKGIGSDGEYAGGETLSSVEEYIDDVSDLTDEFTDQIVAFVRSSPNTFVERFAKLQGTKSHEALASFFSIQIKLFRENISSENLNADRAVQYFLTMNSTMEYIEGRASRDEMERKVELNRLTRVVRKFGVMPASNIRIVSSNTKQTAVRGGRSAEKRERDRQIRAASKQPKGAKPQVYRMQSV